MHIRDQKAALRVSIKERMAKMRPGDRVSESRSLCKYLLELLPKEPSTICGYIPLADEVDVLPALKTLLERGWQIYLPCFDGKKLVFRQTADLTTLHRGTLNIAEPPTDAPMLDPNTVSHVLVPGRAFTRDGKRLGRGNGGYDHWIHAQRTSKPDATVWGIAYECQLVNEVPWEEHDEAVDSVITARETYGTALEPVS